MSTEINTRRYFSGMMGTEKYQNIKVLTKEQRIDKIKLIPAVVVRGHLDHLIEMDIETDVPRLKWKEEALNNLDENCLRSLGIFAQRRYEAENKKGVINQPITKHTYS